MHVKRTFRVLWVFLRRGVVNVQALMNMGTFVMVFYVIAKDWLAQLSLSAWLVFVAGIIFFAGLIAMGGLDYSRGSLPTELEFSARHSKGFQIIMLAQVAISLGYPEKAVAWIQGFLASDPQVSQMSLNAMVAEIEELKRNGGG